MNQEDKRNQQEDNSINSAEDLRGNTKVVIVRCHKCGSSTTFDPDTIIRTCPFCNSEMNTDMSMEDMINKPHSLLPFTIDKKSAMEIFDCWIKSRSFAPGDLDDIAGNHKELAGIYLPYWMFDGDVSMAYAEKQGFDRSILKNIKMAKISGRLSTALNNILIGSTESLPQKALNITEPNETDHLISKEEQYLSGFITERYVLDLRTGRMKKNDLIDAETTNLIRGEIFWNQQRKYILSKLAGEKDSENKLPNYETNYKLMLLPLWYGSYDYGGKNYKFIINGRTGKVHGQRPYSHLKGVMLLIGIIMTIAVIFGYAIWNKT